jgi:hypothetical protein
MVMAAKFFLQSTTNPHVRFEILGRNKDAGTMKLKGQYAEFEEPMDKELMAKFKYTIVKEEDHADAV